MLKVVELFAGVGGFRIGLEKTKKFKVIWSNQWEPLTKTKQHASWVYEKRFGKKGHVNKNIEDVKTTDIPDCDVLVGGFPCQDYSVATTLKNSKGLKGKKGVLWWSIERILREKKKKPKYLILENVDRLLKSPSKQRGRDFAIMLGCLRDLGYIVEWRVINAADYGFPQRRRRIFLVGYHKQNKKITSYITDKTIEWINRDGVLAKGFKIEMIKNPIIPISINADIKNISKKFGKELNKSPFLNTGILLGNDIHTYKTEPIKKEIKNLGSVLEPKSVKSEFYIDRKDLPKWEDLKGPNFVERDKDGFNYKYSMGGIGFDKLNKPSRTIITGEGGKTPSRFKHIIELDDGRYRRLTPIELEKLNGFPKNWTKLEGVSDTKRAFLMGNALVCGVVEIIGKSLADINSKLESYN